MKQILYLSIVVVLFFSSCGVPYKQVPYFQDLKDSGNVQEQIMNLAPLKIQKDDILAITVSSLNPEASAIFNMGNTTSTNPNVPSTPASVSPLITANGFLVDSNGDIQLPLIGSVRVNGLTTTSARELIQSKLGTYLKEPVVSLRLVNFKVSVLGDVAKPGVFPVQTERISLPEALSLSGDLNITAMRKNVLLIRENQGKREFIRLDLNKKEIFNSPYYYLQNNDVLYVQPSNAKYASVDSSYRNIGLIVSVLSVIALVITRL
ncbi:polysaccharide biosynthesis/export family protein [Pedobacter sp.]|jgi:polysaccharide export outer membrane protein|uniref:polysaccharide biosynthesis/export family protein n=1 Tax=Pedobacter sp. TaxID=1411316 RepID=UPI002B7384CB|nr:polysaccharide biosynthesis/export family protein [Pedobacter sp.]HWW39898.1 polysaccharide biosynthesis/export family protein [Pedobacter sp.]